MDSKQIDVMVADASHEVYVDKIFGYHPGSCQGTRNGHRRTHTRIRSY